MIKKRILKEGMRAGDLKDLVLPLISVDEYESTVDNSSVAIGFYVHDEDAANDLNRFIQKSAVSILSSEVSPAPDQHGFFIVFVELLDNDVIGKNMKVLLKEIENLCEIDSWKMRIRKIKNLIPFSEENLVKYLKIARTNDTKDKVIEFFIPSVLSDVRLEQNNLILEGSGIKKEFSVIDFGPTNTIIQKYNLQDMPVNISNPSKCNNMIAFLGENWSINEIKDYILIENNFSDYCILLSE